MQDNSQDQDTQNNASFSSSAGSSIPSTPATSVAKRRAESSTADAPSKKKMRVNAHDALFSVSQSLDTFGERMSTATRDLTEVLRTSNTNSSPERRARALEIVRREVWLPLRDRIRLGSLVGKGQTADEYVSWTREGSPERKAWVCMTLGHEPDYYKNLE
ncbi:hypothetical protein DFH09DRAFT_936886 [Mycena vulgaris]|nr:hypothetical protein DFH09DRAFT_936886 [Mycena vulgaris]